MKRRRRVRPRFFVFSAILIGGLILAIVSLDGSSRAPSRPREESPPPSGQSPVIVSTIPGRFTHAALTLPMALTQFSVVSTPPAAVDLVGGYTRSGQVNPFLYTLTEAGAVADGRMTHPHANGGTLDLSGRVQYVGGIDAVHKLSARIQPVSLDGSESDPPDHWLATPLSAMATASTGSVGYIIGGETARGPSSLIERVSPDGAAKAWVRLPQALAYPMAAVYRGMLWVVGGYASTGHYSATVYTVDLISGEVTDVAQLPVGLANGAIAEYDHNLWILGGVTAQGDVRTTYVITPSGSIVHPGPSLPVPVRGDGAFILDGRLWVGGGTTAAGAANQTLWWYRPPARAHVLPRAVKSAG